MQTSEPLKAVSNVIELDPNKKYLFVLKGGVYSESLKELSVYLKNAGIQALGIHVPEGNELDVMEVLNEKWRDK